ncbi:flagellar hook-associated protein FlgK [Paenalcaligenes sp. Me131]|uniref:flagellar hook-associated protein FlgK n=1 Tax=Paenalcaligenes sp. Me131 TaxID=3392636 RepID=UPI003D273AEE
MNLSRLGLSALQNAQQNLQITGHNISNSKVEGYNRQTVLSQTAGAQNIGAGYVGRGVQAVTVQRAYDSFVWNQLVQSQSAGASLITYGNEIAQVNNLFGDRTVGISPAIQNFFDAMNAVASSPSDPDARQELLGRAQSLVTQFNDAQSSLKAQRENINTQVRTTVAQVNSYVERIHDMNQQITAAKAATPDHSPNDLLDQREQLVMELNQLVDVKVIEQDGVFNLTLSNGQVLLGGSQVFPLQAQTSNSDPSKVVVAYTAAFEDGVGKTVQLQDSNFKGGQLGGLLRYRSESLDATQNYLGRLAVGISSAINAVHAEGFDLSGEAGGEFFRVELGKPIPSNKSGVSPAPDLNISLADANKLTGSDYQIEFRNGEYSVKTLPNGPVKVLTPAEAENGFEIDGVTFKFDGAASAVDGDSWLVQPTRDAAARLELVLDDPAKVAAAGKDKDGNPLGSANGDIALKLAELQETRTLGNGSLSFNEAYGQLVNKVAVQAQQNATAAKAQANLIQQNYASQQRISGVNEDEEVLNLDKFLQQYRAASRMIEVSSNMFDTLLGLRN